MKFPPLRWIALAAPVLSGLYAAPPDPPEDAAAALIARLADESYRVRVESTRDLWEMGEKALPELHRAAVSEDPEIAMRAKDLMRKIELGILPDSSPEIVDLVMRYDGGTPRIRREVIDRLRRLRAWGQLLKIYAMERDQETLNMIGGAMEGVALDAAREALAADPPDIGKALSYLETARSGPAEWMAAAAIHRTAGTLEKELAKLPAGSEGERGIRRYTLLAAAGRTAEAAKAAETAGLESAAARLRLLEGDPLPWLRLTPVADGEGDMFRPGLAGYREFAIRRWQGQEPRPGDLRHFRRLAETAEDEEDQEQGLAMLYLAGDAEYADHLLAARFPIWAFSHHQTFEKAGEALAAAGLDPMEPDYAAWAATRFHVLIHKPDDEREEMTDLILLGSFMERHGLYDELRGAFLPGLKELSENDPEQFVICCSRLFNGGPELAQPVVSPVLAVAGFHAKEDDALWHQLVSGLFDRDRDGAVSTAVSDLWEWLGALDPGLSRSARLEWLTTLWGYLPDRGDRVAAFLEKAWPDIEKMADIDRDRRLGYIALICGSAGNAEGYLKVVEAAGRIAAAKNGGNPYSNADHRFHLASLGRWREAADLWLEWVRQRPEDPLLRAYASSCLRRAGADEEAAGHERAAERLSLAEPILQNACASIFALAGDFERAGHWWRRAAVEATTPDGFARSFVGLHKGISGPLLLHARENGDWKLAAALSEAEALQAAISGGDRYSTPSFLRLRLNADMARAFAMLGRDRERSLRTLAGIHRLAATDGSLGDYFYPTLRERGLKARHDEWFEQSWALLEKSISRFPASDSLRNTAGWTASRANRRLDEAETHLAKALEFQPHQAAYLDTMAEIRFARRDRPGAVAWSEKAIRHGSLSDPVLIRQHERFKGGPFPAP